MGLPLSTRLGIIWIICLSTNFLSCVKSHRKTKLLWWRHYFTRNVSLCELPPADDMCGLEKWDEFYFVSASKLCNSTMTSYATLQIYNNLKVIISRFCPIIKIVFSTWPWKGHIKIYHPIKPLQKRRGANHCIDPDIPSASPKTLISTVKKVGGGCVKLHIIGPVYLI